jgi:hypothetical protein
VEASDRLWSSDIRWAFEPGTGAAVSPDLVGITLATTISMVAGSSQTDRDTAAGQAAAAAQVYLNNLRVGDPLIINDIAAAIRNSSAKILDVGAPNRQIDEIYIWRSRADASRYSRYHRDHNLIKTLLTPFVTF